MLNKNVIFVFDLDGTLMPNSHNCIDPSGIKALSTAANAGDIIIASARSLRGIFFLLKDLAIKPKAVIALNGALTFFDGQLIVGSNIPDNIVKKIIDLYVNEYKEIWLYTKSQWFSSNSGSEYSRKESYSVGFRAKNISMLKEAEAVLKMTMLIDKYKDIKVKDAVLENALTISKSNEGYTEICSYDVNKYSALKNVTGCLKLINPLIFAAGDSDNDIEILSHADFACAVGNSTSNLRSHSDYSSKKYYGEGALDCVLKFIKSFNL